MRRVSYRYIEARCACVVLIWNGEASRIAANLYRVGLNACVRYWRQLSVPFYFFSFSSLLVHFHLSPTIQLATMYGDLFPICFFFSFLFVSLNERQFFFFFFFFISYVRSLRKDSTICTRQLSKMGIDCLRIIWLLFQFSLGTLDYRERCIRITDSLYKR